MAIQLATAGSGSPRDQHFELSPVTGLYERCVLLEAARTNNLPYSADFSNAAWVKTACTVTTGVADPQGGTSACTLTATGANGEVRQTLAPGTSIARTNSAWIRRRTGSGVININTPDATAFVAVTLTAQWQRFSAIGAASINKNTAIQIVTSGDAVDVYNGQQEDASFASSDIVSVGASATTRVVDTLSLPHTAPPQESTWYCKFYERGTSLTLNAGLWGIGASTNAALAILQSAGGAYALLHRRAADVYSIHSVAPALGNLVELRAVLYADGSIQLGQSINGATEVVAARSAVNALATSWFDTTLTLNSRGAGTEGFAAIAQFKVLKGVQTLAAMRAA